MYGICVIKAGIVLSIVYDKYSRKIGNILGAFNYANYFEFTESHFVGYATICIISCICH